jgi:ABC-type glutathione transport system ATPase component
VSAALLEVDDLCVDRGAMRVLDGVSFALRPGETLGIVGESGSGKSTLARAVLRLLEPSRGRVRWRGRDLLELPERELPSLVTIACVVGCFGSISVTVQNIHVAAAVCATVQAITSLTGAQLSCTVSA